MAVLGVAHQHGLDVEHLAQAVDRVVDAAAPVQVAHVLDGKEDAPGMREALDARLQLFERHALLDQADGLHHDHAGGDADRERVADDDREVLDLRGDHQRRLVGGGQTGRQGHHDRFLVTVAARLLKGATDLVG